MFMWYNYFWNEQYTLKYLQKNVTIVETYFKIICMEGAYEGKIKHDWLGSDNY